LGCRLEDSEPQSKHSIPMVDFPSLEEKQGLDWDKTKNLGQWLGKRN
jgi:hypothetical protein